MEAVCRVSYRTTLDLSSLTTLTYLELTQHRRSQANPSEPPPRTTRILCLPSARPLPTLLHPLPRTCAHPATMHGWAKPSCIIEAITERCSDVDEVARTILAGHVANGMGTCLYLFVCTEYFLPILVAGVIRNQGGWADLFTANIGSFRFHGPSSPRCFYVIDSRRTLMKHLSWLLCTKHSYLEMLLPRDESFDRILPLSMFKHYLDI